MTTAQLLDSHVTFADEGDTVVIATTSSAASIDLADAQVFGTKIKEGYPVWIIAEDDMYISFSDDGVATINEATVTTATANGGVTQCMLLPGNTLIKKFIRYDETNKAYRTYLHTKNANSVANSFIRICLAGQVMS